MNKETKNNIAWSGVLLGAICIVVIVYYLMFAKVQQYSLSFVKETVREMVRTECLK